MHLIYIIFEMINVAVFQFNPICENTIAVWDSTSECVIIDAGGSCRAENEALASFIKERGLKVVAAINTHGHFDHLLGVDFLQKNYGVPLAMHSDDAFLLDNAQTSASVFGVQAGTMPSRIDMDLQGRDSFGFGETELRIISTPGHTPGHVCFFEPQSRTLFTGDTLFRESIGRTDLPGGDYSWIMKSILDKIIPLGDDVRFYPGHGPESTIGHETLYNPFITEVLNREVNF